MTLEDIHVHADKAQEHKGLAQAKSSMGLHGHDKRIVHAVHVRGGSKVFIHVIYIYIYIFFLHVSTQEPMKFTITFLTRGKW